MGILKNNFERALFSAFTGYRVEGQSWGQTALQEWRNLSGATKAGEILLKGVPIVAALALSSLVLPGLVSGHEAVLAAKSGFSPTFGDFHGDPGQVEVVCEGVDSAPVVTTDAGSTTVACFAPDGTQMNVLEVDGMNTIGAAAGMSPTGDVDVSSPTVVNVGFEGFGNDGSVMSTGGTVNSVIFKPNL